MDSLILDNVKILADLHPSTYKDNYASAILFPFVNRVKNGKFSFNSVAYELDCNKIDENNALHGLVYDKYFNLVDQILTPNYGLVTLRYEANGESIGFPFKYTLELTYTLHEKGVSLTVNVLNTDQNIFPFTIGWHSYFTSSNLFNSALKFECDQQFQFDNEQNNSGITDFIQQMPFQIKDKKLDDAYILKNNQVHFYTPEYGIKIVSTSDENFLQVFTPEQPNMIAIEAMTGLANSFNNNIGLQILKPEHNYNVIWNITIEKFKDKSSLTP
jgi:aldose 1-epimerase